MIYLYIHICYHCLYIYMYIHSEPFTVKIMQKFTVQACYMAVKSNNSIQRFKQCVFLTAHINTEPVLKI